ncbi:MAG: (deoxy)nucleoside triphosphate pyrophosphohydrolase [Bacilli bacterium]|jgi:8-oxo-dGTP diphosphatase
MEKSKKTIKNVVAAVIEKDNRIFAAQRKEKDLRYLKYEFPGGKIEKGESPLQALQRELKEELNIEIKNPTLLCHVSHDYGVFQLEMDVFLGEIVDETAIKYHVHHAGTWFTYEELDVDLFLPADQKVVKKLLKKRP